VEVEMTPVPRMLSGAQFEQLPMFMTAPEILNEHKVWEPDRQQVDEKGKTYFKYHADVADAHIKENGTLGPLPKMSETTAEWKKTAHMESDEDMMKRKYRESTRRKGSTLLPNQEKYTLKNEIVKNGALDKPIHLTPAMYQTIYNREAPNVRRTPGDIVGGHHRIAVMSRHRPTEFMPVMFHQSMTEALRSGHYA
jgi:hypothetical protein